MYKVFVDNKTIFLTESLDVNFLQKDTLYYQYLASDNLQMVIDEFVAMNDCKSLLIYHEDLEKAWEDFKSGYKYIEAAGGLVANKEGNQLFIFRHEKWDLPKGKLEKGENAPEGAIREVEEECGISGLSIVNELPSTYHTYEMKGKKVLKRTYWYNMNSDYDGVLTPQLEEAITEVRWIGKDDQDEVRANTYGSITDVLDA